MLAASPPAFAANAVYGGSTSAGEPIVIRADAKAKKLGSAVLSWVAPCDDGMRFPISLEVTAVRGEPGFVPAGDELSMQRNGKGRFSGVELGSIDVGEATAAIVAKLAGKLAARRASGTLSVDITILDKQSGQQSAACHTGRVGWSATRDAGRVFGGKTSQDAPIVLRTDAKKRRLADVMLGWDTADCQPDGFFHVAEHFTNFPLKAGRFANSFQQTYDDGTQGGKVTLAYELNGSLARKTASGVFHATSTDRDATGATTTTCDSGRVTFKAATG
jgi:hypothetical protein